MFSRIHEPLSTGRLPCFLLAANAIYLAAKGAIFHESTAHLIWSIGLAAANMLAAFTTSAKGHIKLLTAKSIIWLSFAFMILSLIQNFDTLSPNHYPLSIQYMELAWASLYCIVSLCLVGKSRRKAGTS